MANRGRRTPPPAALATRPARRSTAPAAKVPGVASAYAGTIADLPRPLIGGVLSERTKTILIPSTVEEERALKSLGRFDAIRLDEVPQIRVEPRTRPRAGDAHRSSEGAVAAESYEPDARARAVLRGRQHAELDLRAAGGTYSIDDVRALLNHVSRQAVDKRVKEGTLLAVPGPGGGRRFPTVQFDKHGGVVKGLKPVSKALGFSSAWAVLNFLVNGNDRLGGRRPIDVLRDGNVEPVVAAAASVGEQGM